MHAFLSMRRPAFGLRSRKILLLGLMVFIARHFTIAFFPGQFLTYIYALVHQTDYDHREDFSLHYTKGKCLIIDSFLGQPHPTLRDIWRKATEQPGLFVLKANLASHLLELDIYVEYPVKNGEDEEDSAVSTLVLT